MPNVCNVTLIFSGVSVDKHISSLQDKSTLKIFLVYILHIIAIKFNVFLLSCFRMPKPPSVPKSADSVSKSSTSRSKSQGRLTTKYSSSFSSCILYVFCFLFSCYQVLFFTN